MKFFGYILIITIFVPLIAMEQANRVPPLKALAGETVLKTQKNIMLPEDINLYLKELSLGQYVGNPQEILFDMVQQNLLIRDEQISFLKQKDATLDLNKKYHPKDKFGITVLMLAAQLGNMKALEILLRNGARINETNMVGWTALEYAARFGQMPATQFLVNEGANLNMQDGFGRTALIQAVRHNHPHIVKILLEAGANRSITDNEGLTAYNYAQQMNNPEIIKLF